MRVECNRCGHTSVITSSSKESENIKKLYCCCHNPECGHTFVMDLAFSHTLSPSAMDFPEDLLKKIRQAGRIEQQGILSKLA